MFIFCLRCEEAQYLNCVSTNLWATETVDGFKKSPKICLFNQAFN